VGSCVAVTLQVLSSQEVIDYMPLDMVFDQVQVSRGSEYCYALLNTIVWCPQETTAEELENAYRTQVWHPFKGHLQQHGGIRAARVDLHSLTNEAKVGRRWSIVHALTC
jgi:hypothetical protein